jgi:hypothetical protein
MKFNRSIRRNKTITTLKTITTTIVKRIKERKMKEIGAILVTLKILKRCKKIINKMKIKF